MTGLARPRAFVTYGWYPCRSTLDPARKDEDPA